MRRQLCLRLNRKKIVDLFAGGGGASKGIKKGLKRPVDFAINHDPEAVAMHEINHPETVHYCENVWDKDPREVTQGDDILLLWMSPDCKHHSKAKGGKPVEKKIRSLAWVGIKWVGQVSTDVLMLENVEEFRQWGPLIAKRDKATGRVLKIDGTVAAPGERTPLDQQQLMPDPKRKGKYFQKFVRTLEAMGFKVEWRELRACDYGAPTTRKRLFLIARSDGKPIRWPHPTHGAPDSLGVKAGKLKPWRTAAECIDWSIPCPSIFDRKKPLAEATLRRIARGLKKYVIENPNPFIVGIDHRSSGDGASWGINQPLTTVTSENRHALVVPTLVQTGYGERDGQAPRAPGLEKPLGTVVAGGSKHALVEAFLVKNYGGNYTGAGTSLEEPMHTITAVDHHSLVTANLVRQFGNSDAAGIDQPVGTIMPGGGGKTQLVTSHLVKLRGTNTGSPVDAPVPTITAGGLHIGEVRAFLIKYYSEGGQDQDLREPMHTIPTRDRMGLVTVHGEDYIIADIGLRMLKPHELYAANGFDPDYIIDIELDGRPLTQEAKTRMCGNCVPPPLPEAMTSCNFPDEDVLVELEGWSADAS